MIFGLSTVTPSDRTADQAISDQESLVAAGYRYDMLHQYHRWDTAFPFPYEEARSAGGQAILMSWQATLNNGSDIRWVDITSGKYDGIIDAQALRIGAMPGPVYLNFMNEPEITIGRYLTAGVHGTEAEFAAAWRHIHGRFTALRVPNVKWTLVYAGIMTANKQDVTRAMYPGDAYVDWIGWDPFNWAEVRGNAWLTFSQMAEPWYGWAVSNLSADKPYLLAETGTAPYSRDAARKPAWFAGMQQTLQARTYPLLRAVCYFNHSRKPGDGASGDWTIDDSAASRAAYNAMITSAYPPR